jgi:tRNA (mo5U34)-methyltransferase
MTGSFAAVPASPAEIAQLHDEVAGREWYHTLELAPGVVTPGWFDLRPALEHVPLPASLAGLRCLDIGTFDGFWAFTMERRGAAEVVAVDLTDPERWDWPPASDPDMLATLGARKRKGAGFDLAHRALGSRVQFLERSVYDLDPGELGTFDFVYLGSLLLHLRDPVRALERVRSVCSGRLLLVDTIDASLTAAFPRRPVARLDADGRPWWWQANAAGLARMATAAGFAVAGRPRLVRFVRGAGQPIPRPNRALLGSRVGRRTLAVAIAGDPHAAFLATPR